MFIDIEPSDVPLPDKEWHKHLESMLNLGQINPDILPHLDYKQQWCINEIKKTFKRIKYRNETIRKVEQSEGVSTNNKA